MSNLDAINKCADDSKSVEHKVKYIKTQTEIQNIVADRRSGRRRYL